MEGSAQCSCEKPSEQLCSCCHECINCCAFTGEVCKRCGGHLEGLEVPGDEYCELCACHVCGAIFSKDVSPVEDVGCTACYETEGDDDDDEEDREKKRKRDE